MCVSIVKSQFWVSEIVNGSGGNVCTFDSAHVRLGSFMCCCYNTSHVVQHVKLRLQSLLFRRIHFHFRDLEIRVFHSPQFFLSYSNWKLEIFKCFNFKGPTMNVSEAHLLSTPTYTSQRKEHTCNCNNDSDSLLLVLTNEKWKV